MGPTKRHTGTDRDISGGPVSSERIRITGTPDGVDGSPEQAVMS